MRLRSSMAAAAAWQRPWHGSGTVHQRRGISAAWQRRADGSVSGGVVCPSCSSAATGDDKFQTFILEEVPPLPWHTIGCVVDRRYRASGASRRSLHLLSASRRHS